jgi:hypothetical protein
MSHQLGSSERFPRAVVSRLPAPLSVGQVIWPVSPAKQVQAHAKVTNAQCHLVIRMGG